MERILLIEQDPFVRTDMAQALERAFPEDSIRAYESLDDVDIVSAPQVMLIDVPPAALNGQLAGRSWFSDKLICVLTGVSGQSEETDYLYVARPFTDDMLVSTVQRAFERLIVDC